MGSGNEDVDIFMSTSPLFRRRGTIQSTPPQDKVTPAGNLKPGMMLVHPTSLLDSLSLNLLFILLLPTGSQLNHIVRV